MLQKCKSPGHTWLRGFWNFPFSWVLIYLSCNSIFWEFCSLFLFWLNFTFKNSPCDLHFNVTQHGEWLIFLSSDRGLLYTLSYIAGISQKFTWPTATLSASFLYLPSYVHSPKSNEWKCDFPSFERRKKVSQLLVDNWEPKFAVIHGYLQCLF